MIKHIRTSVAALFLVAACSAVVGAKSTGSAAGFDFAKTGAFMREMETRPDFPVSIVLANDYVYSLLTLGGDIAPARKSATVSFIKETQQKSGGFIADKADKNASLLSTDLALETLGYLGAANAIDAGRARSFVASLKNPDGGFGFSQVSRGSSLASTYHAVRILKALGALDLVDREKTARYIKGFERKEGGFGYVKGAGVADPKNTYMAAFVLNAIGRLDEATRRGALKFLAATPYLNAGSKEQPELDGQLHTVLALKELKAGARIDRKLAMAFLRKVYVPVNGGFGPLVGYGSTPDSTTAALRILSGTGSLKAAHGQ